MRDEDNKIPNTKSAKEQSKRGNRLKIVLAEEKGLTVPTKPATTKTTSTKEKTSTTTSSYAPPRSPRPPGRLAKVLSYWQWFFVVSGMLVALTHVFLVRAMRLPEPSEAGGRLYGLPLVFEEERVRRVTDGLVEGRIIFTYSEEMVVGQPSEVEVRIAKSFTRKLEEGINNSRGNGESARLRVSDEVGVVLSGGQGVFFIQLMGKNEVKLLPVDEFAQWIFSVTPLKAGYATLYLTVSNQFQNSNRTLVQDHPAFKKQIHVKTSTLREVGGFVQKNWKELSGFLMTSGGIGMFFNWIKRRNKVAAAPSWEKPL
jgi:hypothetical protein